VTHVGGTQCTFNHAAAASAATAAAAAAALVYFVQGILGLSRLALSFFFKDDLGVEPAQVRACLTGWCCSGMLLGQRCMWVLKNRWTQGCKYHAAQCIPHMSRWAPATMAESIGTSVFCFSFENSPRIGQFSWLHMHHLIAYQQCCPVFCCRCQSWWA
jgi:hypothetical protein